MRNAEETEALILELQGQKSNLLLEAKMLLAMDNPDEAVERYALAAPMEERIARFRTRNGEKDLAALHRFSAAVCYMKSGNLRHAVKLFDALGRQRDIPGKYQTDALLLAARLRQQQRETLQGFGQSVQSVA